MQGSGLEKSDHRSGFHSDNHLSKNKMDICIQESGFYRDYPGSEISQFPLGYPHRINLWYRIKSYIFPLQLGSDEKMIHQKSCIWLQLFLFQKRVFLKRCNQGFPFLSDHQPAYKTQSGFQHAANRIQQTPRLVSYPQSPFTDRKKL